MSAAPRVAIRVEGGIQFSFPWFEVCPAHPLHVPWYFDCKRCGRYFCPCEGGVDDLDAPSSGFNGHEVCDTCWDELAAAAIYAPQFWSPGGRESVARAIRAAIGEAAP